ncbi:MAG: SH3 domain-containing protein, partial [Rubrivivax sp.]|nr:SH3 domain-containing protein [Rubrivivax sp.]
ARAIGGVNVRTGPGTTFAIVGSLVDGQETRVTGRDAAGDWLRLDFRGHMGWAYAPLLALDCELSHLTVAVAGEDVSLYTAPLQAFYLKTGLGEPACAEAPRDGVLVQAPQDATVHFLVNGVEVTVGSTAFLSTTADERLRVYNLAGAVAVTSAGRRRAVVPGYRVTATADEPPGAPQPYAADEVIAAPVRLLPEPVQILTVPVETAIPRPSPTPSATGAPATPMPTATPAAGPAATGAGTYSVTVSSLASGGSWADSGIVLRAGQVFSVTASGTINLWVECPTQKYELGVDNYDCSWMDVGPGGNPLIFENPVPPMPPVSSYPMPAVPNGALLGRIDGGPMFHIGAGGTFTADRAGSLRFMINDVDYNNSGAFTAVVTIP